MMLDACRSGAEIPLQRGYLAKAGNQYPESLDFADVFDQNALYPAKHCMVLKGLSIFYPVLSIG